MRQSVRDLQIAWSRPLADVFQARQAPAARQASTPEQARAFAIIDIARPTPDAVTLVFANDTRSPLTFEAGQFVTLCVEIDGATHRRSYSMCSDPAITDRFALTIKRVPGGLVSNWLNDLAEPGMRFVIEGPHGRFVLGQTPAARRVFVAGGSGITPIMAMLRAHCADPDASEAVLLYANRAARDVIFAAELAHLAADSGRLRVHHILETPGAELPAIAGRITPELLAEVQPAAAAASWFVCGPEPMMDAVTAALAAAGVPPGQVLVERFATRRRPTAGAVSAIHRVELRRSGLAVRAASTRTLLEASHATAHPISSSCQVGGCGSCRVRVLSGEVEMEEPNCLTPAEQAEGYRLACISRPCSDVVLDA